MRILIMGLPGSGKTTLASELVKLIGAAWLNADEIRKKEICARNIGIFGHFIQGEGKKT